MNHKLNSEKTWNWFRKDVDVARAGQIGEEMGEALYDRCHNFKEFVKHPFNKDARNTVETKHHYK